MTRRRTGRARAWAELLRVSALFSVPGDALAGAAAAGARPGRGTLCAIGASLCLYEAGMALNDWADRAEDAAERPHRPLPSGRIAPSAALAASAALTAAGLALASRAGRPSLAVATALAATVWAYDLGLKHTPAGPGTMATARALDLLLGATASTGRTGRTASTGAAGRPASTGGIGGPHRRAVHALPSAALLGAHTYAVTAVSRHETQGGSTRTPLAALAVTLAVAGAVSGDALGARPDTTTVSSPSGPPAPAPHPHPALPSRRPLPPSGPLPSRPPLPSRRLLPSGLPLSSRRPVLSRGLGPLLALAYARTPATLLLHAALNPSAALTERAVGGGIRATIPLQAALAARAGAPGTALALLGLVPAARALARKVSPT
ncbi:UbiA family prenyltransferase [Streptomyces sp. TX20-6-3]|uniref:SCO3242 family prenyltransferase n=1 Tax=Streptomyces sp. TX20-6-3 TaxID=3028705 RepID=UPI0029B26012|nr:UbiA family prenyltransferase [Streptomyces sp. TX20-6-3]MDX2561547.1 UbiA family prenyltransferase [Streptomyces sp. TX20-6-3]